MSGPVTPAFVQQIQDLINVWNTHQSQLGAWLGGTMNGGPNEDGRYPLVDARGRETLIPSPAAFSDMVYGPANVAELAKVAAELARESAEGSANRSNDQRILAEAARGASIEARNLAQEHRNHAGTHEANARYWAELAQSQGQGSAEDRAIVEQLAEQVADDAALAAQDADDAATSAALAATFNPALYDLKSDTLAASRLSGMIDPARIPVLVGQTPVVSTGGIAALTTTQQNGIMPGTLVATTDGRRWVYSGSGSKTVEANYIEQGDVTPTWSVIADKPSFFPTNIANVSGLQSVLDSRSSLSAANQFTANQRIQTSGGGSNDRTTAGVLTLANFAPGLVLEDRSSGTKNLMMYWDGFSSGTGGQLRWVVDVGADGTYADLPMRLETTQKTLYVNESPVLTAATLADSDAVTTSQTNLGKTGNGPLVTLDNATFAAAPTGYSAMTMPLSVATPLGTYGYILKHGRRDVDGGWGASWITHTATPGDKPRGYIGATPGGGHAPAWAEFWTDANLAIPIGWLGVIPASGSDLNAYMTPGYAHQNTNAGAAAGANYPTANAGLLEVRKSGTSDFIYQTYTSYAAAGGTGRRTVYHRERYGGVWSSWLQLWDSESFDPASKFDRSTNTWITSADGKGRAFFNTSGRTFFKGAGIEFRNEADTKIGAFEIDGSLSVGRVNSNEGVEINNVSPTIFLRDTNHRSAMIHVNENKFYVLRGSGNNSTSWETTGSGWPMVIDLSNNSVEFNGDVNVKGDTWLRVHGNTGIYFQNWGGGWHMTDTTWIRAWSHKNIVTNGTVQMGAFTVTSDARLKTNIVPITNAAEIIDATNVYEFTKGGRRMFGMLAQEAQQVAPILVSDSADLHPEDGDPILALDQTGYIPLLVEEVKALRRRVSKLEGVAA
ncbi:tail fiber domain-containing protein [Brevundimonas diminuta]|uniref:tail fiber domain-containing protein n=1 Tax=Brevundimonas diminuta TaxID=293 RepID=UPI0022B06878|nr:tail fiber domain-containing protein [Brevundimonas diminuta]MCZ4108564.1 tail fiber domain-containing protein [Brevundimonas diminuta]